MQLQQADERARNQDSITIYTIRSPLPDEHEADSATVVCNSSGRARPASRSLAEHRLHNLDVENNPGGPKIWLRGIVKIWQCRGQGHTLWR